MKFEDVKERIYAIPGFLMPNQEKWLFEMAKSLSNYATILEIGGYLGRSTCCLAFGCVNTCKRIFTVDTFDATLDLEISKLHLKNKEFYKVWRDNIKKNELLEYVTPLVGLSRNVAKVWRRPIDFLVIDGSHQYEDILADFKGFFPYVVQGGIVAFHDVEGGHPDVVQVWNETVKCMLAEIGSCQSIAFGRKIKELDK